jgi:DDE_Tnp_1-associated
MNSLREAFEAVPEYRQWHSYDLAGILSFLCLAMLCGCNREREIARWGQAQRWALSERLGFANYRMPSLGTIQRIVRELDGEQFAQVVGAWGRQVLGYYGKDGAAISIDGKTLRGSAKGKLPALHLLSAFSQELRVILGEVTVEGKTNEIKAIHPLLADLVLEGCVVTVDALLTQHDIAQVIVEKKATI